MPRQQHANSAQQLRAMPVAPAWLWEWVPAVTDFGCEHAQGLRPPARRGGSPCNSRAVAVQMGNLHGVAPQCLTVLCSSEITPSAVLRHLQLCAWRVSLLIRVAKALSWPRAFFSTDLFANSSARSQCRKLTENVSGTEVLEMHKSTGRAGPIRECGWREPQAGRSGEASSHQHCPRRPERGRAGWQQRHGRLRWTTRPISEVRGRRCKLHEKRLEQRERGSTRAGVRTWMLQSCTGHRLRCQGL